MLQKLVLRVPFSPVVGELWAADPQRALPDISMPRGKIDSPLSRGNFRFAVTLAQIVS